VPRASGLDPAAEAAATVRRFTGQVVPHDLRQIGADGSAKLPHRLAHPLRRHPDGAWPTLAVALWLLALDRGQVADPHAEAVAATTDVTPSDRAARVLDLLGLDTVGGRDRLAGWLSVLNDADEHTVRDVVSAQLP
jgi:mannitol-1-phosphate/altronate dehydrogenase